MKIASIERSEKCNEMEFHRFDHLPKDCLVIIDNDAQMELKVFDCKDPASVIDSWKNGKVWF